VFFRGIAPTGEGNSGVNVKDIEWESEVTTMRPYHLPGLLIVITLLACGAWGQALPGMKRDLTYKAGDGFVDVLKGDVTIARYVYKDVQVPFVYPLSATGGPSITMDCGSKDLAKDELSRLCDSPASRSFWVGLGKIGGVDFWNPGSRNGRVVQTDLAFDSVTPDYWNIHANYEYRNARGKKICSEERRYAFHSYEGGILVSLAVIISADVSDLTYSDSADGFVGVKMVPGKPVITNSEGRTGMACRGQRATWVDYTVEMEDRKCGITMFDLPINPNYPAFWNVSEKGLLAANPFGGFALTGDAKNDSTLKVDLGGTLLFAYVLYLHEGAVNPKVVNGIAEGIAQMGK